MATLSNSLQVINLRCENLESPLGMDILAPQFRWEICSDHSDTFQTAYQIQIQKGNPDFSDNQSENTNFEWDSGKTKSNQSIYIEYQGQPLESRTRYYYRVKIWDNYDRVSEWAGLESPSWFEMGLLNESDWEAKWITSGMPEEENEAKPVYYFRKTLKLTQPIKKARIYASALGLYELQLNGQKVGDEIFTPGQTDYSSHIQYQTYDITAQLTQLQEIGQKPHSSAARLVLGAILGEGWYRGRYQMRLRNSWGKIGAIIIQLELEYQDGHFEIITTDESWKVSTGPILLSDIYDGEIYDARLETEWNKPTFDDSSWKSCEIYKNYPYSRLKAELGEKIKKIQKINPIKLIKTPKGETVIDIGQNMVGWLQIRVKGQSGQEIIFDHGEVLIKGNFYRKNLRSAKAQLRYICKGSEEEVFEPHFTFFGFRYVRIQNYENCTLDTVTGIVIHSDMAPIGKFECSNPLVNRLQHNILWGQKGNFLDVPTDCPQRNERVGWTGDAQVFCQTANYNMDTERFFTKWMKDLRVSQLDDGGIPPFFPGTRTHSIGSSGWGDVATILPWAVYESYGNKRTLEEQYESMKAWVEFEHHSAKTPKKTNILTSKFTQQVRENPLIWASGFHYGDWLAPNQTIIQRKARVPWIATAFFAYSTLIVAKTAQILGKKADEQKYLSLYNQIQNEYQTLFLQPDGSIRKGFQTAYVLALEFGLIPKELKKKSAKFLVKDIQRHHNHLTTGFLGVALLNFALSNTGNLHTAYELLLQETCPSWLYAIKIGDATTIWERWNAIRPNGKANSPVMTSFNHYAYGAIGNWLYRVVAGINPQIENPGYKHIIFNPQPDPLLSNACGTLQSRYGKIESSWEYLPIGMEKSPQKIEYKFQNPPNTTAEIILPHPMGQIEILEPTEPTRNFENMEKQSFSTKFRVGNGYYHFRVTL